MNNYFSQTRLAFAKLRRAAAKPSFAPHACGAAAGKSGEGGIRTLVPFSEQAVFETVPLWPLRYLSFFLTGQIAGPAGRLSALLFSQTKNFVFGF